MTDTDPLEQRIIDQLDRRATDLDGATASRLNQARQAALQQLGRRRWYQPGWWMVPAASGLAVAAVLAVSLGVLKPAVDVLPNDGLETRLAEFELLADDAELALLDELDFFLWVEGQMDPSDQSDPLG